MRTIRRLIEAKKLEREENGEAGFSLIELIIVVVILGILVAIAIPIFSNIQDSAKENSLKTAAANAATAAAAVYAKDPGAAPADVTAAADSASDGAGIKFVVTGTSVDTICVTATGYEKKVSAGPKCTAEQKKISDAPDAPAAP